MSKKNIILLIIVVVVIGILLFIYQSGFLFNKNANYGLEINNNSSATLTEEDSEESPDSISEEMESPKTGKISDEVCIEIYAYVLRMAESSLADNRIQSYANKIEELEKKYGVDSESDSFIEYCEDRFLEDAVYEKLKEKMRELGSDIE